MRRIRWWWLAGAMTALVGCGDDPPSTPPRNDAPAADAVEEMTAPDADTPDQQPPPDMKTPPPDVDTPDVTPPPDVDTPDMTPPPDVDTPDTTPPPDVDTTDAACSNPGETRCGDACVDTMSSNAHCGTCGNACAAGQVCRAGVCATEMTCGNPGETRCGAACVNTATDAMNCGSCGNACAAGQSCSGGACVTAMPCPTPGQTMCGGACVDTNTDGANCGRCGSACAMGQVCRAGACAAAVDCSMMPGTTACAGTCVNLMTDATNCGACGTACAAGQVCTGGVCGTTPCPMGQMRCGAACVDVQADPMNCGMCGRSCATGQTCAMGACTGGMMTCVAPQTMCPGGACANLQTDPMNCGMCGRACAAGQTCAAGACVTPRMCPTGQTDCTPTAMTATCVDLNTSAAHCGACGMACPMGTTCAMGRCACPTGQTLCGRTCVNTASDAANCGACGTRCAGGQTCQMGMCRCPTGQTSCGGACVNAQTDNNNCGACMTVCAGGQTCQAGRCACPTGQITCGAGMAARCTNTMTDRANCGACGAACPAMGQTCTSGRCACPTGQTACTAGMTMACIDLQTSATNCGMCGRVCATGTACTRGVCMGTPPSNDTRAGATLINLAASSQTLMANTTFARHDVTGSCACTSMGNDVFYRFVLTQPEVVYADTLGATADTALFFLDASGTPLVPPAGGVTCNDDVATAALCPGLTGLQSQVAARLPAGTYYLVLSGCTAGASAIHFQHVPAGSGTSTRITPGATSQNITGATAGAGAVSNTTCCSGGPENSAWWLTCPGAAATSFHASSCGAPSGGANAATYDIELAVYSALRPTSSFNACNDDVGTAFTCNAGASVGATIPATTANQAGVNSLILDSCIGTGSYTVRYVLANCAAGTSRCGAACADTNFDENNCGGCDRRCPAGNVCSGGVCYAPPTNDTRASATAISLTASQTVLTANNAAANNSVAGIGGCACTNGRDVFYSFRLTRREVVYADTVGSSRDTSLAFLNSAGNFVGAATGPGARTCNDDGGLTGCATGLQSQVMNVFDAGDYYLLLSGCGEGGPSTIRFQHLPVGNGPLAALPAGTAAVLSGTTAGTGTLTGTCCSSGPENTYLWYTCQGATAATFLASTCGRATWDTSLSQRSAARAATGIEVCNDDAGGTCGARSQIGSTIPAGPGIHALYVDGCLSQSGAYGVQYTRP